MCIGGEPTIKGDCRLGHYDTTHTDQFQGRWNAAPATLPAVSAFLLVFHFGTHAMVHIHLQLSLVVEVLSEALEFVFRLGVERYASKVLYGLEEA